MPFGPALGGHGGSGSNETGGDVADFAAGLDTAHGCTKQLDRLVDRLDELQIEQFQAQLAAAQGLPVS
jgi:hypothetical protein